MWTKASIASVTLVALLFVLAPGEARSWELSGGAPWKARVGPGIFAAFGGNDCNDHYCDRHLDTRFLGSAAGLVGGYWRIIPNLVVFIEIHTAYINTDSAWDDDRGFLFETVGGAEFHVPITGWLDAYVGGGLGFIYLGHWGDGRDRHPSQDPDFHDSLRGFDFQWRTGADFYLFSRVPTLGLGPLIKLSTPFWASYCVDGDDCRSPDDTLWLDGRDLPAVIFFGGLFRYGF